MTKPDLRYDVSASHREDLLDEALDESFPASDPVSLSPDLDTEPARSDAARSKAD
jgi:hypothetical protein